MTEIEKCVFKGTLKEIVKQMPELLGCPVSLYQLMELGENILIGGNQPGADLTRSFKYLQSKHLPSTRTIRWLKQEQVFTEPQLIAKFIAPIKVEMQKEVQRILAETNESLKGWELLAEWGIAKKSDMIWTLL